MRAKPLFEPENGAVKPVLLLLHGFLGSGDDWQTLRPLLEPHFRLLTPDLPGHGRQPLACDRYDFNGVCEALCRYLAREAVTELHLLGYSLGGRIALHLAGMLSQADGPRLLSLTLESSHPGLVSEQLRIERLASDSLWAERLEQGSITDFLDAWYRQGVFAHLDEQARAALIAKRSQSQPESERHALRAMYLGSSLGRQADLSALPLSLHCPFYYVVGEQDAKFTAIASHWQQALADQGKTLQLIRIANAGHHCHGEQPEAVASALLLQLSNDLSRPGMTAAPPIRQ
ncbi:2-succinyl-6-hydroxy-2,4-cyclohexadiene-1-carboxylate synthase [Shewanella sp. JM162201]|uniref:Putative 2-succinyl-6-hydroxy-2,4-cyclohexadiene-1-carboxylate synthase n=1 Tax=Shewanella jiangmenensis TaxID=2837387 RepID=A0ABS5V431_9GAMM|nr:2-succinyl-6-hydroxy-2,4-cyclohexadiene-1-carboxylate synthase [Shewanella jiangmenensis]MBT1445224.1 2-succinyl-6-hydroxy-2,4-cyclohexadiene-1-carboxylate synthase [Shewanella jiangmenensis]